MVFLLLVVLVVPAIALGLIGLLVAEAIQDACRDRVDPVDVSFVDLIDLSGLDDVDWAWPSEDGW